MQRWIPNAIIYQVNLRALAVREPRNAIEAVRERRVTRSALRYITLHLQDLKKLGVNVLHLMPPFLMGIEGRKGIGSPYCARDFKKVDPEYGTIDELRALVQHAHKLGFKVILGMVPNHTSRDHVWTRTNPEFYVRKRNGTIAYDIDWSDTAKLNYKEPGLRKAMYRTYDFWLGFLGKTRDGRRDGVDGFRLDMAHYINDRSFWDEALPKLRKRHAGRELLFLAECYGRENNLDLFARGMTAAYDDELYKVMEYLYGVDEDGESIILPDPDLRKNDAFRDKYKQFRKHGIAAAAEYCLMNYERVLPLDDAAPRLARYTDNHDESRGIYRYGPGAVRAMNRLIFLSGHTLPFLLSGQEFGALNRPAIHDRIRPCEKSRRMWREGHLEKHDGIEIEGNVFARGQKARREWYDFYRALIRLRQKNAALVHGSFRLLDSGEQCREKERSVVAFERKWKKTVLRCAVNLGPDARELLHAPLSEGRRLYGGLEDRTLPPFSAIVARLA